MNLPETMTKKHVFFQPPLFETFFSRWFLCDDNWAWNWLDSLIVADPRFLAQFTRFLGGSKVRGVKWKHVGWTCIPCDFFTDSTHGKSPFIMEVFVYFFRVSYATPRFCRSLNGTLVGYHVRVNQKLRKFAVSTVDRSLVFSRFLGDLSNIWN